MPHEEKASDKPQAVSIPQSNIRLPIEILGQIYLENDLPHFPADKGSRYPPMAVSKTWRNAALLYPQLWVHINITQYSDLLKSSTESLQTWLSRSKPRLLEVVMYLSDYHRGTEKVNGVLKRKYANHFRSFMKVLFAQTYRWGSLDVRADDWQFSHVFQVLERANQLRELTVQEYIHPKQKDILDNVYEPWGIDEDNPPNILLPSVMSLSFSLSALSISDFPSLSLPNLTELALKGFQIDFVTLMEMMERMPKLDLLRLEPQARVSCPEMPEHAANVVSGLKSLVVCESFLDYDFLPHLALHCPNLRDVTLHYTFCRDLPSSPLESLTEITLILVHENHSHSGNFSDREARNALMLGPNARELKLVWAPRRARSAITFDPFIKTLAGRGDGQERGVLLKLEHLKLETVVLRMSTLLEMLRVRSGGDFETIRSGRSFYLTLGGCFGLPDVYRKSISAVTQLLADPPEVNMTFCASDDPYGD